MQCLHVVSTTAGVPQVVHSQLCPGQPLGSPDGAQLDTVSRGLASFPLQCLLHKLHQQLGELAGLIPHGLLQPPQPCQVLAFHLAVLGLEVGTLWTGGGGGLVRTPG